VDDDAPQAPQTYARTRGAAPGDSRFIDVPDDAFIKLPIGTTAIVTSTAQNDSGMFELNLKDERYLPFEGAGRRQQLAYRAAEGHQPIRFFDNR